MKTIEVWWGGEWVRPIQSWEDGRGIFAEVVDRTNHRVRVKFRQGEWRVIYEQTHPAT